MVPDQQKHSPKRKQRFPGKQLLRDLRKIQEKRITLPEVILDYRVRNGRVVSIRERRGSYSGDEEGEVDDDVDRDDDNAASDQKFLNKSARSDK